VAVGLLEDQREGQVVEPRAVVLGRHRDAVTAECGQALQFGLREVMLPVPARGLRRDAVAHIGAHGVLHGEVVVGQQHGGSGRRR
jgi:hypothetical protein